MLAWWRFQIIMPVISAVTTLPQRHRSGPGQCLLHLPKLLPYSDSGVAGPALVPREFSRSGVCSESQRGTIPTGRIGGYTPRPHVGSLPAASQADPPAPNYGRALPR